jgi:hypothetical protein
VDGREPRFFFGVHRFVEKKNLLTSRVVNIKKISTCSSNMSEASIFQTCTAQVGDAQNVTELLQCISDANEEVSDDKTMPTRSWVCPH